MQNEKLIRQIIKEANELEYEADEINEICNEINNGDNNFVAEVIYGGDDGEDVGIALFYIGVERSEWERNNFRQNPHLHYDGCLGENFEEQITLSFENYGYGD